MDLSSNNILIQNLLEIKDDIIKNKTNNIYNYCIPFTEENVLKERNIKNKIEG